MFCLSNIAGGTVAQIQTIMDEPGLFKKILQMADGSHYLVQHEAFWVIANVINTGSLAQAKLTVPFKSIRTLCEYIPRSRDKKILSLVLKTIEKLLSYRLDLPGCCERVQECKGVDDLERLLLDSNMNKDAQNNQVYATAERILTTFFGNESEQEEDASDEQNCSPAIGYKLAAGHETDNVFSNNNISHSNEGFVAEASPPPSKQLFPELSHSTRYLQQRQHQGQQYPYPSGERSLW